MGNKFKLFLLISCILFLGIVGFSYKAEAGGCIFIFNYGAYPGSACSQVNQTTWNRLCDQSYPDCQRSYYWGNCWGSWYDVYCSPGDVTAYCSSCGNSIVCPTTPPKVTTPPTNPPGEVKDCGESGCNDAPYPYCTSGNRCDGNVCNRISCPDGYTKSGYCDCVFNATPTPTFTPTPPPKICGQSGCNIGGCTPSNMSCISDICQINNCPAGHSVVNYCNCLPPCSTLSASFNKSSCTLDISISGASAYLRNLAFSGPPVSTITQNILYRHTITSAGIKAWTLTWQEVASVGSATPRNCSTTISNLIPEPSCGTVTKSTNPAPAVWGESVTLNAQITKPTPPAGYSYVTAQINSILNPVAQTNCGPLNIVGSSFTQNCFLPYIPGTPKQYAWDVTYRIADASCASVISPSCSDSVPVVGTNRPGYMSTENGVAYIGIGHGSGTGLNNQPRFNPSDNLSTNIFGSSNSAAGSHVLSCVTNGGSICSSKKYLLLNYSDINSNASWYSYLSNSLLNNPKLNVINKNSVHFHSITESISTKVNLINIAGSLTVDGDTCDNSNIYLIRDNLEITPDLTVNSLDDACLFIVGGTTTIRESTKIAMTCGGNIDNRIVADKQDKIQAFIITNNFTTNISTNTTTAIQLYIKGGVITNTFIGGLNRDVNSDSCIFPNLPSELIDYEGARYIKNLRDALVDPTTISIFENQYKSSR